MYVVSWIFPLKSRLVYKKGVGWVIFPVFILESAGNEPKTMADEEDKSVHKEINHSNVENDVATDSYVEKGIKMLLI